MKISSLSDSLLFESKHHTIKASLQAAVKGDADLRGANLHGASLSGASLSGASLIDASLIGANLGGADLINANLIGARLDGANLTDARLDGASLSGAYLIDAGQDPRGYRFVGHMRGGALMILAGCRYFTADEAARHWGSADYHGGAAQSAECLARMRLIETLAQQRGWIDAVEIAA